MSPYQRLNGGGPRGAGSLMSRLGLLLASALALLLTAGLVVAGFFIGIALLGLFALFAGVFWLRRKLRGGPARHSASSSRRPVVIDGEFVVLSSRPRPRNSE